MQGILPDIILVLTLFQQGLGNEYSGDQDGADSRISGYCSNSMKDGGPCVDDGEAKLYRWDPVKVCSVFRTTLNSERN